MSSKAPNVKILKKILMTMTLKRKQSSISLLKNYTINLRWVLSVNIMSYFQNCDKNIRYMVTDLLRTVVVAVAVTFCELECSPRESQGA